MTPTLGSQKTPEAYEEALLVTEGLLLGAAHGGRTVTIDDVNHVIETATGHRLDERLIARFLGDLVERTYPNHMMVLSVLVDWGPLEELIDERRPGSTNREPPSDTGDAAPYDLQVSITGRVPPSPRPDPADEPASDRRLRVDLTGEDALDSYPARTASQTGLDG